MALVMQAVSDATAATSAAAADEKRQPAYLYSFSPFPLGCLEDSPESYLFAECERLLGECDAEREEALRYALQLLQYATEFTWQMVPLSDVSLRIGTAEDIMRPGNKIAFAHLHAHNALPCLPVPLQPRFLIT